MITPAERDFALKLLDETGDGLLHLLDGLSLEQLLFQPEPGRWSVAENVEHLVMVEKRVVPAIEKMLHEPPDHVMKPCMGDEEVLRRIGTVVDRVQAPERSQPASRWPAGELRREFETARRYTRNFVSSTNGDLRHHFINHWLFGDFDTYQWLLLIGSHTQRHTIQSKNVIASPNFPQQDQVATKPA
jgi:hypothetical protein